MYRPPENTNRVKAMKSKFETTDSEFTFRPKTRIQDENKIPLKKVPDLVDTKPTHLVLTKQLSDPGRRHVKRTPAFRLEKNRLNDTNSNFMKTKCRYLDKVKQSENPRLSECDTEKKISTTTKVEEIRNKFSNLAKPSEVKTNAKTSEFVTGDEIKALYSEPIPKCLRNKQQEDELHENSLYVPQDSFKHESATLKVGEKIEVKTVELNGTFTDTLKSALKRPLPAGPAPKKPPRTFIHSPKSESKADRRISSVKSLNLDNKFAKKLNTDLQKSFKTPDKTKGKGDPKYMLDKLESALKNNKIRLKRLVKVDTTSEDDSDDSFLEKNRTDSAQKFNFNCLNLSCSRSNYETIKEPNSSFFVKCDAEEPLYAEPYGYQAGMDDEKLNGGHIDINAIKYSDKIPSSTNVRRSLHYMSSPVLGAGECVDEQDCTNRIIYPECDTSSSTSTSDMDSTPSTPSVQNLIRTFELHNQVKSDSDQNSNIVIKNHNEPSVIKNNETSTVKNNNEISAVKNNNETSAQEPSEDGPPFKDRIKELEVRLRKALESLETIPSFQRSNSVDPSENIKSRVKEPKSEYTNRFATYVKRVRSKVYATRNRDAYSRLFHCCLLVELDVDQRESHIKCKYPEKAQIPAKIEVLCFPEIESGPMDRSEKAQCYSLVMTDHLGERTFGYCRRVLPEGSKSCLPLVYCILSSHRAPGFYGKILLELESRHGCPDKIKNSFMNKLYYSRFPKSGESVTINCNPVANHNDIRLMDKREAGNRNSDELDLNAFVLVDSKGEYGTLNKIANGSQTMRTVNGLSAPRSPNHLDIKKSNSSPSLCTECGDECMPPELIFTRPMDSRHEEMDLKQLCATLPLNILQQVFSSLLLERKVILVSCVLSTLSSCIEALQSILYPFSWPHTLIPVVPKSLWEILETPTPLICGVLSNEVINKQNIEYGIVVDLDTRSILLDVGDEVKVLPYSLLNPWKHGLQFANNTSSKNSPQNVLLGDAFLKVFINSCGHYKDHIVDGLFIKSTFIEKARSRGKGIRSFLKWFTETTMFNAFIQSVVDKSGNYYIFDQRIQHFTAETRPNIIEKIKTKLR